MKNILNLIIVIALFLMLISTDAVAAKTGQSEIVGKVSFVMGKAMIKKAGTDKWVSLKINTKVTKNDVIKTPAKASVKIKFRNKKIAKVKPNSTVKIASLMKRKVKVTGSLKSIFEKTKKSTGKLGVTAVAGVRGADVSKKKDTVKPAELLWEE